MVCFLGFCFGVGVFVVIEEFVFDDVCCYGVVVDDDIGFFGLCGEFVDFVGE